jgi:hypothetical protein
MAVPPCRSGNEHGATNGVWREAAATSIDVQPQIRRRLRLAPIERDPGDDVEEG